MEIVVPTCSEMKRRREASKSVRLPRQRANVKGRKGKEGGVEKTKDLDGSHET